MKKIILFTFVSFFVFLSNAQDNWIYFKDYPIDININLDEESDLKDTPFVFKNKEDQVYNYILPVKFTPIPQQEIASMDIKIKSVCASYDTKGRLMIYFRGKVDMSCCYQASMSLEFFDDQDNLIQLAKTDAYGNFKLKGINGNLMEISKGRIKFNFTKLKSFDANADVRYSKIEIYETPIDSQFKSKQTNTVLAATEEL